MNYSYKGKILISTPDVSGDVFSRSVVLIIDHNENGAFGLILNKKNEALSDPTKWVEDFPLDFYDGGPVGLERMFFIMKGKIITEDYIRINDEFYLTEDAVSVISERVENGLSIDSVKAFMGYSGWSAGQLENELLRKLWTVVDVYNLDYTLPNDQNLWKKIMQNLGGEFLLWANAPEDVTLN